MRLLLLPVTALLLFSAQASAFDLRNIDRTIKKEPVYKTNPRYCLLVFGPEARTRVWLVLDGDVLYVDRNASGDLTEPGDRLEAKTEGKYGVTFEAGDVRDGPLLHTSLSVIVGDLAFWADELLDYPEYEQLTRNNRQAKCYAVTVHVAMPGWHGSRPGGRVGQSANQFDAQGILQFSEKPENAPVIHFGGPWTMSAVGKQSLTTRASKDLFVDFGTPGLGPGTFAYTEFAGLVPGDAFPVVDIAFPPSAPDQKPLVERYTLKGRC